MPLQSISESKIISYIKKELKKGNAISLRQIARHFDTTHSRIKRILKRNNFYEQYIQQKELIIATQKAQAKISLKQEVETEKRIENFKQQVNYWKRKYRQLLKISAPEQQLIEIFKSVLHRYKNFQVTFTDPQIPINFEEELILLLSDFHLGEEVQITDVFDHNKEIIINKYDIDIFKERIDNLYQGLLSIVNRLENGFKYKTLNIFMLGDMVSGIIHDELLENSLTLSEQIVIGACIIAEFIYKLAQKFQQILVYCIVGNHHRYKKKPYFKNKWDGFDYILYKFIETKLQHINNVFFIIPKSPIIIVNKYNKWNFLLRHGDGKSQSFAGIPVYGIMRTSAKATQMIASLQDIYIHYEVMGHYHTAMSLPKPSGKIIVNGTLKGIDEYVFNQFLATEVSQKLLILNKNRGLFADIDIYCD